MRVLSLIESLMFIINICQRLKYTSRKVFYVNLVHVDLVMWGLSGFPKWHFIQT